MYVYNPIYVYVCIYDWGEGGREGGRGLMHFFANNLFSKQAHFLLASFFVIQLPMEFKHVFKTFT